MNFSKPFLDSTATRLSLVLSICVPCEYAASPQMNISTTYIPVDKKVDRLIGFGVIVGHSLPTTLCTN
jgi:hypothetical protein